MIRQGKMTNKLKQMKSLGAHGRKTRKKKYIYINEIMMYIYMYIYDREYEDALQQSCGSTSQRNDNTMTDEECCKGGGGDVNIQR